MDRSTLVQRLLLAVIVAAGLSGGCRSVAPPPTDVRAVTLEVEAALHGFEDAQRRQDVPSLLAYLAPRFFMLQDGDRLDRRQTVDQIEATIPTLRRLEPSFTDVELIVLAPDAAVTAFRFRDVIEDTAGIVSHSSGTTTLVWRSVDGVWRIVYADSTHAPPAL